MPLAIHVTVSLPRDLSRNVVLGIYADDTVLWIVAQADCVMENGAVLQCEACAKPCWWRHVIVEGDDSASSMEGGCVRDYIYFHQRNVRTNS